jgi:hypothetical protein
MISVKFKKNKVEGVLKEAESLQVQNEGKIFFPYATRRLSQVTALPLNVFCSFRLCNSTFCLHKLLDKSSFTAKDIYSSLREEDPASSVEV